MIQNLNHTNFDHEYGLLQSGQVWAEECHCPENLSHNPIQWYEKHIFWWAYNNGAHLWNFFALFDSNKNQVCLKIVIK